MSKTSILSLLVVLLLPVAELASAQNIPVPPTQIDINRNDGSPASQSSRRVTQLQAVDIAKQRFEGTVLRISVVGEGASQRYQIRMENEGKIFTVFVNATTGRISGGG